MTKLFIFLTLSFLLLSCKKENGFPPDLQVNQPAAFSSWSVGDTVMVSGSVTSQSTIQHISIVLINQNLVQQAPPVYLYPQQNNYEFNVPYVISNSQLQSGNYYLKAEAVNEFGNEIVYINVSINAVPTKSNSLVVYTASVDNQYHQIYNVDSLLQTVLLSQLDGDFCQGAVSSFDQTLFSISRYNGNLYLIDASSGNTLQHIEHTTNYPFPCFQSMHWSQSRLICGMYDGRIEGYYGNGMHVFSYSIPNCRAHSVSYDGEYLLTLLSDESETAWMAGVLWEASGMIKDVIPLNGFPLEMYRTTGNDLVLFVNENNQAVVYVLDTYTMELTDVKTFSYGELYGVTDLGNNEFLLRFSNAWYRYKAETNTADFISTRPPEDFLVFDQIDQVVYSAKGKTVSAWTWPAATLIGTVAMQDSVRDMHVIYNH